MERERTSFQKVLLCILLAMAVVFGVITLVLRMKPGVRYQNALLKISQEGDSTVYSGRAKGEKVTIWACPQGEDRVVKLTVGTLIDHTYRVEYPGGTIESSFGLQYDRVIITRDGLIRFDGGYHPDGPISGFCDREGEVDFWIEISVSGTAGGPWQDYEMSPTSIMAFANGPETTVRGSGVLYALGLFFSAFGAVFTAFPYTIFYLKVGRFVRNSDAEPSDAYLTGNWIGCLLFACMALVAYLVGVFTIV